MSCMLRGKHLKNQYLRNNSKNKIRFDLLRIHLKKIKNKRVNKFCLLINGCFD